MKSQGNWFSRLSLGKKILFIFLVIIAIGVLTEKDKPTQGKEAVKPVSVINKTPTKAESAAIRKKSIEDQFSAWNGVHINLERAIKTSMNNPKSFEHVQSGYTDMGDYILVETKFRGTNAFGAIVMNSVRAKVDLQGNILEIIGQ